MQDHDLTPISLSAQLDSSLNKLLSCHSSEFSKVLQYSTLGTGKKLRPRLFLATLQAFNQPLTELNFETAAAFELFHAFTLVHDDLPALDNDDLRRGKPTTHIAFSEGLALLGGDALLLKSISTIYLNTLLSNPACDLKHLISFLNQILGADGLIGAQADELIFSDRQLQPQELFQLYLGKTGYLFEACIFVALQTIGIQDPSILAASHNWAREAGILFQILDDLEDSHSVWDKKQHFHLSSCFSIKDAQELYQRRWSLWKDKAPAWTTHSSMQFFVEYFSPENHKAT